MKIAVIGSLGAGKTYFCNHLHNHYLSKGENATVVDELSRQCPLPVNEKSSKEAQAWILFNQIVREIQAEKDHKIVICDRSILDNYAYFVRAHKEKRDLDAIVKYWMPSYDFVFKIRASPQNLIADGFRSTSVRWQKEMDARIDRVLKDFNVKYSELPSGAWKKAIGIVEKRSPKKEKQTKLVAKQGD
ncbi:MAG: AAA family ATPase [Candidatus Diapherotrites archaeon]